MSEIIESESSELVKEKKMDGGLKAWVTVFGVFINYFFMFGFLRAFSVLIDPMVVYYNSNYKAVSVIPGAICLGFTVTCLLGSPVLKKIGIRKLAFLVGPITTISYLFIYAKSSLWYSVAAYIIMALSFGFIYLMCVTALRDHFCTRLTLATQIGTTGSSVGMLIIPNLLTYLLNTYSYSCAMLVWAGLNANILVACILLLPNYKSEKSKQCLNDAGSATNSKCKKTGSLFKTWTYWIFVLQQLALNAGYASGTMFLVSHTIKKLAVSDYNAALLVSIQGIVDLISRIPWGYVADYEKINRHYLLSFACFNMAIATFGFIVANSYLQFIVLCIYIGLFSGLWGGLSLSCCVDIVNNLKYNDSFLPGIGISTAATGIAVLLSSLACGQLTDLYDSYIPTYIMAFTLMFSSAIFAMMMNWTAIKEAKNQ